MQASWEDALCSALLQASGRALHHPKTGTALPFVLPICAAGVSGALSSAIRHLESLGAVVEEVSLPSFAVGLPAYYVIALSEASSNLSRYDGVRYGHRAEADGEQPAQGAERTLQWCWVGGSALVVPNW